MKPFNLERALAGDAVVTHDSPVIEIKVLDTAPEDQSVVAVVDCGDGQIYSEIFGADGQRYDHEYCSAPLQMATTKRTVWVIVVRDTYGVRSMMEQLFDSEQKARSFAAIVRETFSIIGVFPLEIEE